MARNYPADVRLQSFYRENYEREDAAKLAFYYANKSGQSTGKRTFVQRGPPIHKDGLPTINPMQYALQVKKKEEKDLDEIIKDAKSHFVTEEMRPADERTLKKLYTGFTKEEKGRYSYLRDRHEIIPEQKFTFPTLSSMKYGWKLADSYQLKRPNYARTRLIKDTFYTANGVPTLDDATRGQCLDRGYTLA
ncbi:hypothetical protein CAPTEDRAFT_204171 [Capitella teleta]|uniref:Sperm microtubule inner protein 1 C-terminal domain-containing protein n=1 Tax=Capitella teleta TaxID=283909 RepID=R7T529_CAPTE|nr:hypothetical protein CAPTEDRAFT_204171 [Capitella teleta]|eukprot:ELT88277.1 hypothetical protein CAPTEDRAFT_204171 [Capitella teleta]